MPTTGSVSCKLSALAGPLHHHPPHFAVPASSSLPPALVEPWLRATINLSSSLASPRRHHQSQRYVSIKTSTCGASNSSRSDSDSTVFRPHNSCNMVGGRFSSRCLQSTCTTFSRTQRYRAYIRKIRSEPPIMIPIPTDRFQGPNCSAHYDSQRSNRQRIAISHFFGCITTTEYLSRTLGRYVRGVVAFRV